MPKTRIKGKCKGRGRTSGAVSLVKVKLSELISSLKPEASIVVGRRWLENIGIEGQAIETDTKTIKSISNPIPLDVKDFNQPDHNSQED